MLDDTTTQFRAAVQERIADPTGGNGRDLLTRALAALVAEARQHGMTAEQLVIRIKREWAHMADAGLLPPGNEHESLRNAVVTSAIRAYYVQ